MYVIFDRQTELLEWASARLPTMRDAGLRFFSDSAAIGVANDKDEIIGCAVLHGWRPQFRSIEVSAAADDPRWLRCRAFVPAVLGYAFYQCGVDRIWSATPAKNLRALKFVWGIGFKKEAVLERHLGDDDVIISRLFREEWENVRAIGRRPEGEGIPATAAAA